LEQVVADLTIGRHILKEIGREKLWGLTCAARASRARTGPSK
jgi:hypothetical protein